MNSDAGKLVNIGTDEEPCRIRLGALLAHRFVVTVDGKTLVDLNVGESFLLAAMKFPEANETRVELILPNKKDDTDDRH